MKQPYRWLLGMAILLVILAATYYPKTHCPQG
jgi:hypothetical protein